jgi:hypothetical protein
MTKLDHYPNCSADYPEKPEGEPAQHIIRIDLEDGEYVLQCSDCGAYVVESNSGVVSWGQL